MLSFMKNVAINPIVLSVVLKLSRCVECHYNKCRFADCQGACLTAFKSFFQQSCKYCKKINIHILKFEILAVTSFYLQKQTLRHDYNLRAGLKDINNDSFTSLGLHSQHSIFFVTNEWTQCLSLAFTA